MRSVDTNVLVRFLTEDDRAQFLLAKAILRDSGVWIAKTVLLETEWVLRSRYHYTAERVHQSLNALLGLPGIAVEDAECVHEALRLFGVGLDFADALHLASRPDGATFVTFDDAFVRRAKRAHVKAVANPAH